MGNNFTCTINCNCRIGATVHTVKHGCFRYIFVNSLHNGDDDDDDDDDNNFNRPDIVLINRENKQFPWPITVANLRQRKL
jgi:hypothetical protein